MITKPSVRYLSFVLISICLLPSCSEDRESSTDREVLNWSSVQDSTDVLLSIDGFSGPEAVRYDPEQDVYFVSNFNGDASGDANGFISRVTPDGIIESLEFMTGTDSFPMHGPRGMYITGDILWVADADGVHGFNRFTGKHADFVDFSSFEPGFLNDIVAGENGNMYVTDTGKSAVYIIEEGSPSLLIENLPAPPNGITKDSNHNIVLAPWGGATTFYVLELGDPGFADYVQAESGGNFDGIEFLDSRLVAASQVDSSLHVLHDGEDHIAIHVPGRPADIGLDTKRRQVAVPYIALNRVDLWQLPE